MLRFGWPAALALTLVAGCGDGAPRGAAAEGGTPPAAEAPAPVSSPVSPAGAVPVEITAAVAGREVSASGAGECQHAPDGSIYNRPASLWTVQWDGTGNGLRRLNLAFWQERTGTESVTLALEVGDDVHHIATVEGGELQGRGRATLEGGPGDGVIVVEGTSAEGAAVRLRVRCERFTTLVPEGG